MTGDQKARKVLAGVMSMPESAIDGSVRIGATRQWDSIAHMNLVLAVEEMVGRRLEPSEYLDIDSFDSLVQFFENAS